MRRHLRMKIIRPQRPLRSHDNPIKCDGIETHFGHVVQMDWISSNARITVSWQKKSPDASTTKTLTNHQHGLLFAPCLRCPPADPI